MPQEWTAEVVAQLHLHKLTIKQLAEEAGYRQKTRTASPDRRGAGAVA